MPTTATPRAPARARRLYFPVVIPVFLAISWALYFLMAEPAGGPLAGEMDRFLYRVPDLTGNPLRVLGTFVTAPFLNHATDQIVYATVMLVLFGLSVEVRYGPLVTIALLFGTTVVAALVAGVLLHIIYPDISDAEMFSRAWERTYGGASAAAVGLNGVFSATFRPRGQRRWTWLALAVFIAWELSVWWFYLQNYTPFFHLTALLAGFLTGSLLLPARRPARHPQE